MQVQAENKSNFVTCCNIYSERKTGKTSSYHPVPKFWQIYHAPSLLLVSLPLAAIWASKACLFPWCLEEESQLVGEGVGICCFHGSAADEPCSLHSTLGPASGKDPRCDRQGLRDRDWHRADLLRGIRASLEAVRQHQHLIFQAALTPLSHRHLSGYNTPDSRLHVGSCSDL